MIEVDFMLVWVLDKNIYAVYEKHCLDYQSLLSSVAQSAQMRGPGTVFTVFIFLFKAQTIDGWRVFSSNAQVVHTRQSSDYFGEIIY
jgi:hypothetical protein